MQASLGAAETREIKLDIDSVRMPTTGIDQGINFRGATAGYLCHGYSSQE